MTPKLLGAAAAALLMTAGLGAAGPAAAEADNAAVKPVKLSASVQRKLGLTVEPLAARTSTASVAGYAKVLDAGPLAQLDSDIQAAAAAAQASAAEAARSRALHADGQAVSTKALEAAEAQARADAAKLALLRRRVGLEWGEGVARLSERQRAQLLADIAAGRAALVRIDAASGEGLKGLRSVEIDLGPLGSVHAVVLGAARAADPRLLSPGLIATASGPNARSLAIGLTLPVRLATSGPAAGVLAPSAALLRSQGKTWVYVRTAAESFRREAVENGRPEAGGLFVREGLKAGEPVVTRGAAALFAAETNAGEAGEAKDAD